MGHFETLDGNFDHFYSSAGNIARGFEEIGAMWSEVGQARGRNDVAAHGVTLVEAGAKIRAAMSASLNQTVQTTSNPLAPRCVPSAADASIDPSSPCNQKTTFRTYGELMYSAMLTREQANDVYLDLQKGNKTSYVTRPMTMGCTGYNNKQATYVAYGMAYGLLAYDEVERVSRGGGWARRSEAALSSPLLKIHPYCTNVKFLLHYFAMSAHTYTRGTWTTPEATHPDRDIASTDYVAAGVVTASTYLKWMLLFEQPDTKTVWIAKALPREWLSPGEHVDVRNATTRYGRISFHLAPEIDEQAPGGRYVVRANVTTSVVAINGGFTPPGGVKLRLRAPVPHAGTMSSVTVGGKAWTAFDPDEETIELGGASWEALQKIVAVFDN